VRRGPFAQTRRTAAHQLRQKLRRGRPTLYYGLGLLGAVNLRVLLACPVCGKRGTEDHNRGAANDYAGAVREPAGSCSLFSRDEGRPGAGPVFLNHCGEGM
jgi:hypothetical protein